MTVRVGLQISSRIAGKSIMLWKTKTETLSSSNNWLNIKLSFEASKSINQNKLITHTKHLYVTDLLFWTFTRPRNSSKTFTKQKTNVFLTFSRSIHPELFSRKGVLKICSKFTGEHPYRSVISIKLFCS